MEKVSIILAFRNEEQTLHECMDSLLRQTYKNKEIILVDDESSDKSTEIALDYKNKHKFIKYFRINHQSHLQEWPRICGIKEATGKIIFTAEADAYYADNYLELCAKHLKDKKIGGVLGKLNVWEPKTFISKYKALLINPRFEDHENMNSELAKGNVAIWVFPKKLFDECGGYGEGYYGEERNFSKRMLEKGYKLAYEPEARWWHRWKEHVGETIQNYFVFGRKMWHPNKKNKKFIAKNLYFILPFPLIAFSFFSLWFLALLGLHFIVLERTGIKLFRKHKGHEYRKYALLAPAVSYIQNISFALGFFRGSLIRKK